ncbi:MAG: transposase [Pyramidobacter sp.]|nr:transposase [Pyramidobacter sp.]MBQ8129415.1 transposase [Clostridia bacterium]
MTDYKTLVKAYRAYLIAFAAVALAALLAFWLWRGYGGNANVGKTIDAIKATAKTNDSRIDAILDMAKEREENAKHETVEKVAAVSDDNLPDLLAGLLSEYRKQHPGR